jgi:intracellular sulfur oxidation DsrE/DsrF family protein
MSRTFSHEYLNAFIDGELTSSEREAALARLDADPEFKRDACEMRTLKEMVRGAYGDLPAARTHDGSAPFWRQAWVAGLMLVLGLSAGWFGRGGVPPAQVAHVAGLPAGYTPIALTSHVDPDKVVLHLDSSDPGRLKQVLNMADDLLRTRGEQVKVEVVVNSYGLNLLRQDTTPYRDVIQRLSREHANLSFLACAQTVARLEREGTKVVLIPEAGVASSAIGEILSRMQQGWVYVKV